MFQLSNLIVGLVIWMGVSVGTVFGATDWLVVPGSRVGPISAETSEKVLKTIYGDKQVVTTDIEVGEGETLPGTMLFDLIH